MTYQNVVQLTTFDVKGDFFFYLIIKKVMVEHIIAAELILAVKLAVPKRAKKQRLMLAKCMQCKCQHAFQNSEIKTTICRYFQTLQQVNKSGIEQT